MSIECNSFSCAENIQEKNWQTKFLSKKFTDGFTQEVYRRVHNYFPIKNYKWGESTLKAAHSLTHPMDMIASKNTTFQDRNDNEQKVSGSYRAFINWDKTREKDHWHASWGTGGDISISPLSKCCNLAENTDFSCTSLSKAEIAAKCTFTEDVVSSLWTKNLSSQIW